MGLSYTRPALSDLDRIFQRLQQQVDRSTAADQLRRIEHTANRLIEFPGIGPALTGNSTCKLRVRGTPYSLVYAITDEGIRILRVFHHAQDWRAEPE